jgi:hypothetical protein
MDRGLAHRSDRAPRARAQEPVLADERPVEIAREGVDVGREVGRKPQLRFVRKVTSASSSGFGSTAKLFGITPLAKPGWT